MVLLTNLLCGSDDVVVSIIVESGGVARRNHRRK